MKATYVSMGICFMLLAYAFTFTQSRQVNGRVTDEHGAPLTAVTVQVKGSSQTTATDSAGEFTLAIAGNKSILIFSYVGYSVKEIVVGKQTTVVITLKKVTSAMQEVIVTGMAARQSKIMLRGAATNAGYAAPALAVETYDKMYTAPGLWQQDEQKRTGGFNREGYNHIVENRFVKTPDHPLSTFSIDVDAAAYSNVRRMINANQMPPAGAVRIEELINYFMYDYAAPVADKPFSIQTEVAACPWNRENRLVSIGLQGKRIPVEQLPPSNLTFLIDVSGSMATEDKLPLVQSAMRLLTDQLREADRVAIVVYAGSAGLVLPPTNGTDKMKIKEAINNLHAGGSTAGGQGIELAYKTAAANFLKDGNNRVILCTDGDFNVGISSDDALVRLIEKERAGGVFLTVLGFGTGNYQDAKMQQLADKGNGNHAYIDNLSEAKKVLVHEFGGTLFTIAKDVKLQVEFNPAKVQGYRLIGYENRMLAKEDFNNDQKDAGEMGSGHTVTALYEVIPAGIHSTTMDTVDKLRYTKPAQQTTINTNFDAELMHIKLRYKQPDGTVSQLIEHLVKDNKQNVKQASDNMRFAAAVAQFGLLLRNSAYKGNSSYALVAQLANASLGVDKEGYRKEFVELVNKAGKLAGKEVAMRGSAE